MDTYEDFLREAILGDSKIVSYRLLSRSLKVHVNVAKEMLHEFHRKQNLKQPDSVHATYLLTGYRPLPQVTPETANNGEGDIPMEWSPFNATQKSRQSSEVPVKTILVVPQEELEESKSQFQRLCSIHVYSLELARLKDLNVLSTASQEVMVEFANEDALTMWKTYGTISNPTAKHRSKASTVVLQTATPAPTQTKAPLKKPNDPTAKPKVKEEDKKDKKEINDTKIKKEDAAQTDTPPAPTKKPIAAPAKKTQKDFFSNWNTANKKAKDKKSQEDSDASLASPSQPSQPEESPIMKLESDDDEEEDEIPVPKRDISEDVRKRKAKKKALEDMMDDDDEDEKPPAKKQAPSPPAEESVNETTPPPKEVISCGKRRGKRKVTKQVTARDSEGYLTVNTESVWESFSEDEPEPPPKPKSKPGSTAPTKGAKGKGGKAQGQGSIMSFFQKK